MAVQEALRVLRPRTHSAAVKLADLPDQVRGYEQIKVENIKSYRSALADGRAELTRLADLRSSPATS